MPGQDTSFSRAATLFDGDQCQFIRAEMNGVIANTPGTKPHLLSAGTTYATAEELIVLLEGDVVGFGGAKLAALFDGAKFEQRARCNTGHNFSREMAPALVFDRKTVNASSRVGMDIYIMTGATLLVFAWTLYRFLFHATRFVLE